MYFMLKSVSQLTRPCVCLPLKDLNHDFQFSKSSVKKLLKCQTWGNTVGGSHSPSFTFSSEKLHEGHKKRLNKHHLPPPVGK